MTGRNLPPILLALIAQAIASGGMLIAGAQGPLLQGCIAALLGLIMGLPWWWLPINLLLPPALIAVNALALPPWLFLAAFVLLLLLYWNSAGERVPLYLSNRTTWEAVGGLLPSRQPLRFIDLGSGLGGILFYLARRYPQHRFTGIESSPLPFLISWLRLRLSGQKNIELRYGSLWDQELGQYDVVYAFLSPAPMARLFGKLQGELPAGARFISNSFAVPEQAPDTLLQLADRRGTQLYYWDFPRSGDSSQGSK